MKFFVMSLDYKFAAYAKEISSKINAEYIFCLLDKKESGEIWMNQVTGINAGDMVYLVGSLLNGDDLLRLNLASQEFSAHGARISLVAPYIAYQRKDRPIEKRENLPLLFFNESIQLATVERLFTATCHSESARSILYEGIRFTEVDMAKIVLNDLYYGYTPMLPDAGMTDQFMHFEAEKFITVEKFRSKDGTPISAIIGSVSDPSKIVIIDDMVETGGTLAAAMDLAKKEFPDVKNYEVVAIHNVITSTGYDLIKERGLLKYLTTTDTTMNMTKKCHKRSTIKTAKYFAQAILRTDVDYPYNHVYSGEKIEL